MERIVPIYDQSMTDSKTISDIISQEGIRGTLADLLASLLSGMAGVVALGYSLLFFTRFLENDTHLWGIISAFILCFGLGAFGYIPAAWNSLIAYKMYKRGSNMKSLMLSLVLSVPWFLLSLVLLFVSDLPKIYALPVFITSALLLGWALITVSLRPAHR